MTSVGNPRTEYQRRLASRRRTVESFELRDRQIAVSRLVSAIAFIAALFFSFWQGTIPRWIPILPAMGFIGLVVVHERVSQGKRRAIRAVAFYEDGLARIDDSWIGRGQSTELLRDESHLYAPDLDIFGKASLFELLCTARMRGGEEALADWLAEPASPAEIVARQQAVSELRNNIDLREDLNVIGSDIRSGLHPDAIIRWGAGPMALNNPWARRLLPIPAAFAAFTLWPIFTTLTAHPLWWLAIGIVAAIGWFYRKRVLRVIGDLDRPERELKLLALLLSRIEKEAFHCEKLVFLKQSLVTDGIPPSQQIGRLNRVIDLLNWYRNEFFAPFSLVLLWRTQFAFSVERWRKHCGSSIGPWLKTAGEFEALCALAAFAYEHPDACFPEIAESGPVLEAVDVRHPLVPARLCVPNSIVLDAERQLLVVSGSNMSGKSTLLRTVGINAVLALAGAPVSASRLRISPLRIGATLRIQDSLQAGTSRFYAEIQRIHRIMELTKKELPVLFLLDEVLHGTNSHDRAVGAEAIVTSLLQRGAIGLVTTHDLALARLAEALAPRALNVHFADDIVAGKMVFDYRMRPGVVQKSNALALMRAVGLEV